MRVSLRVTGGLVGAIRGVDLDSLGMPGEDGRMLEDLVTRSGIRGAIEAFDESLRDVPEVAITIESEGTTDSLRCDESQVPREARPLVQFLLARAGLISPEERR